MSLKEMTREEWIEIFGHICEDMQEPLEYLPQGLLLGLAALPILWLLWKILCRNRKPDWVRLCFLAGCIVYTYVLLYMVFFSREPGSRADVNMQLFGTWKDTPKARGYVIENIILFVPFGILLPCAVPFLRRVWFCLPVACLCSIAIEGIQYVTQRGYCQLDDIVMNTVGAGIGWLFYRVFLHWGIRIYERRRQNALNSH